MSRPRALVVALGTASLAVAGCMTDLSNVPLIGRFCEPAIVLGEVEGGTVVESGPIISAPPAPQATTPPAQQPPAPFPTEAARPSTETAPSPRPAVPHQSMAKPVPYRPDAQ